jgi:hypothetical protein
MRALNIVESAYRGTIEEQDDTVVWISRALKNAGGDLDILLRGNAVNYGVKAQDSSGLKFGQWRQTQPPRLAEDIAGAVGKGISVYVVSEDLADRGIRTSEVVAGVEFLGRADLPRLFARYDQVWHW